MFLVLNCKKISESFGVFELFSSGIYLLPMVGRDEQFEILYEKKASFERTFNLCGKTISNTAFVYNRICLFTI